MTDAAFDFDEAFDEVDGEPLTLKLRGRIWNLPRDVDAALILRLQRLETQLPQWLEMLNAGDIPDDLVIVEDLSAEQIVRKLAGDALVDEWLSLGVGYRQLGMISRRLYAYYTGKIRDLSEDPDARPPAGEAASAPNRATRRAVNKVARKATAAGSKPARGSTSSRKSSTGGRSSKRTSTASTTST